MSLRERLEPVAAQSALAEANKVRAQLPDNWKTGLDWDAQKGGFITTGPMEVAPDEGVWKHLIADWGLDPATTEVVPGSVQIRGWDSAIGGGETKRMLYYKAQIRPYSGSGRPQDYEQLYRDVLKASRSTKVYGGDKTFVVCLSDFQTGNPDDEGIEGQLRALAALVKSIPARVKALRRAGVQIDTIAVVGLGDLIEGTCGFYSAQKFRVEIDRREQVKVVRRALRDILMEVAEHADNVKVVCVPGNHGENRDAGKAYTRPGDNDDVAIFEQVADILSAGSAYEHFLWRIPSDEIAVAVDLSGVQTAFTHGHVPKPKGNAAETLWGWWEHQTMGRHYPGVADAEILIAGHFHHLNIKEQRGRTVIVCPSLTNVSEYFSDCTGVNTRHGTLSLVVGDGGWSDMSLL